MGATEIFTLAFEAIKLGRTLYAENRAATQAEVDALWLLADKVDADAVADDDAAQRGE